MICRCRTCCLQAIIIFWGGGGTACYKSSISRVAQKHRLFVVDDRLQSNQASKLGGSIPKLRSWRFCGLWVLSSERSLIVVVLNLRENGIESEREKERCATAAAAADVLVRRGAGSDLEGLKSVFCSLHELSSSPAAPSLLQSKIQPRDLMFSGAKKRSWFVAERGELGSASSSTSSWLAAEAWRRRRLQHGDQLWHRIPGTRLWSGCEFFFPSFSLHNQSQK